MTNKAKWVILNEKGKPVNVFAAATNEEAEARAAAAVARYRKDFPERQLTVQNWDTVSRYNSVFDDTFQTFIDYSDPIAQTGRAANGSLFRPEVSVGIQPLEDMISSIQTSYRDIVSRTRALIYEPEINYAKMAHEANMAGVDPKKMQGPTIWERYVNTIYGGQTLRPHTWIGRVYGGIESFFDVQLSALYNKYVANFSRNPNGGGGPQSTKELLGDGAGKMYEKLKAELTFDPFGSTTKFLEDTYREKAPPKLRGVLLTANQATAALTFRLLDVGTSIMNLGSLLAVYAPVIRSMGRLPGESRLQHLERTGAWGSRIAEDHVQFDWVKASASAAHYVFSKESRQMFARAADLGYFTPEAKAMHDAFSTPIESMNASRLTQFVEAMSWFADSSERLSRKLAFGMGYKIAKDLHKMENENDAMMFAHKVMTEMIGDYRPSNKPQMFQGALGLPLGLFQTYMFNVYRRLFSYIERRDYRTLAVQYAMQSSIYGAQTVPGFDLYSNIFASNYDGTSNPVDNLRQAYGEDIGDWFLYGSLSNIPKVLGAGDGISFYTRGDMNLNAPPTALTLQASPVIKAMITAAQGTRAATDMFLGGGQFTKQQTLEILANYSLNRTMRNVFELAVGEKTDRLGNLVESDTRDALGIVARGLGASKMTTQKLQETMFRQAATDRSQAEMRDRMNRSFRAMVRSGDMSIEQMQGMVGDYLKSGGDPRYFAAWMRSNLMAAQVAKSDRKFVELLKSQKGSEFMRFLSIIQPDLTNEGD